MHKKGFKGRLRKLDPKHTNVVTGGDKVATKIDKSRMQTILQAAQPSEESEKEYKQDFESYIREQKLNSSPKNHSMNMLKYY